MTSVAQWGLLILLGLFLVLHLIIVLKIIPYDIIWGGRLKSDREMYRFEIFSILVNALLLMVVLVQRGIITIGMPKSVIYICLWIMTGLFLLNTLGNITSKNKLEQRLFTPVTILLAVFSLILALSN